MYHCEMKENVPLSICDCNVWKILFLFISDEFPCDLYWSTWILILLLETERNERKLDDIKKWCVKGRRNTIGLG